MTQDDQLSEICGKPNSAFGYGPPAHPRSMWRCGEHRLGGPVAKRQRSPHLLELETADLIQRMVSAWIEANWPTESFVNIYRHCEQKDDNLIPLGCARRSGFTTIAAIYSGPSYSAAPRPRWGLISERRMGRDSKARAAETWSKNHGKPSRRIQRNDAGTRFVDRRNAGLHARRKAAVDDCVFALADLDDVERGIVKDRLRDLFDLEDGELDPSDVTPW